MTRRLELRIKDMLEAIQHIRLTFNGRDPAEIGDDPIVRAAYERFLQIISEASRHIPADLKATQTHVPWPDIAAIGNILRHAYHSIDINRLWAIYRNDLSTLENALHAMEATISSRNDEQP